MRSILTVECVGWFGTKEYLSVIFRNLVRQLIHEGINQLKARAHYSIHRQQHRPSLTKLVSPKSHWFASDQDFTALRVVDVDVDQLGGGGLQVGRVASHVGGGHVSHGGGHVGHGGGGSGDGVRDLRQLGRLVPAVQGRRLVVRYWGPHLNALPSLRSTQD